MHYEEILQKQVAGTATATETEQLQQWLQTLDETALRAVMRDYATYMNSARLQATAGDPIVWQQITATLQQQGALSGHNTPFGEKSTRTRTLWPRITVAAAVLLAIASGTWWWLEKDAVLQPVPKQLATVADKAPASSKATLTLADGSVITLNSATRRTLAQQGNQQVVQLANGQLLYQTAPASQQTATAGATGLNTLRTPRGGLFQVVLPDGTKVWLNAASSLQYPTAFTGATRTVTLTGEAYFEVAPDKAMPFIVTTQNQQVQVLGTAFNINAYSDEEATRTTLLQGSVKVLLSHSAFNTQHSTLLTPNLQSVTTPTAITLTRPDLQQVMAWKEGEFRFQHMKITSIMRQIARWYDVEIEYRGPLPENEFYGVIPRKEYVSQILKALALTSNVHFIMKGNTIIVMAGPA